MITPEERNNGLIEQDYGATAMDNPVIRDSHEILPSDPNEMLRKAGQIAKPLAEFIKTQKLFSQIGTKRYVHVEGWATLGSMLGVLPKEKYVRELDDGSYEAYIELINRNTGVVLGGASSICGVDEERWGNADNYARRSMAITRATGKAYRIAFGWVIKVAGYEGTPAEEMPSLTR